MREDDDIPLLTEVHALPAQALAKAFNVTPELIAEIAEQIRPHVAADIEKTLAQKLKQEMKQELLDHLLSESANIQKANQAYISSALNQQYDQQAQQIEQQQRDAESALKQHINDTLTSVHQEAVGQALTMVDKARAERATDIPRLMHTNTEVIKSDLEHTLGQMQTQAVADVNEKITAALPDLQQTLTEQLQVTLADLQKNTVENATQGLQEQVSQLR
jgi:hypothetical protein